MPFLNQLPGGQRGDADGAFAISVAGQSIQAKGSAQGLANLPHRCALGSAVQPWIGTAENEPVSADQLGQTIQNGGLSNPDGSRCLGVPVPPRQRAGLWHA